MTAFHWPSRRTAPLGGVHQARSVNNTHTHTDAHTDSHTGPEGNSLMPNVPFAITDGSLTFLGKRAMMREREIQKKGGEGLEEKGQQGRQEA